MARKKCARGHVYDYDIYGNNCPFCPPAGGGTVFNENEADGTDFVDINTGRTFLMDNNNIPTEAMDNSSGPIAGGATVIRTLDIQSNLTSGRKIVGLLFTYSTNQHGEVFNIYEGKNYIGRSGRECDICINSDSRISNKHMSILYRSVDRRFKFKDEQSSNGTFVNGELIDEGEFKNFDVLKIGDTSLVFISIPKFDETSDH